MSVRTIQTLLAAVHGGWCLIAPASVIALCMTPAYQSDAPLAVFAVGCFGAQGVLSGLFAATTRFSKATFAVYGLALLPFFYFDWYFNAVVPMFTAVGLLDAAGNVIMLGLCLVGYRAANRSRARTVA